MLEPDDVEIMHDAAPKKKGDGAKKKPKASSKAPAAAEAKHRSQPKAASGPPARGKPGTSSLSGGGMKLKDPMAISFGDSDISMSDLEGDVEIDQGAAASDDDSLTRAPAAASNLAKAKGLLAGGGGLGGSERAAQAPAAAVAAPAAARAAPARGTGGGSVATTTPARSAPRPVDPSDSFERELAAELASPQSAAEYSMGFEADESPPRAPANRPQATSGGGGGIPARQFLTVDMLDDDDDPSPAMPKLSVAPASSTSQQKQQPPQPRQAPAPALNPPDPLPTTSVAATSAAKGAAFVPSSSLPRDARPPLQPTPAEQPLSAPPQPQPQPQAQQPLSYAQPPFSSHGYSQVVVQATGASAAELGALQAQLEAALARADRAESLAASRTALGGSEYSAQLAAVQAEHQVELARCKADAQRELSLATLEGQRAIAAAEAKAAAAEAKAAAAESAASTAERRAQDLQERQRSVEESASERADMQKLGEASRAEMAEAQLRVLREEVTGLKRAHELEARSARESHAEEIAALKRAHAAELGAVDRSAAQGRQLSGLAEQVQGAVSSLSRLQKEAASERMHSHESLTAYQERRAAALDEQEARTADAHRLVAEERAKLQELATSLQNSMAQLASSQGGEKERLANEAQRLNQLHATLERERAAAAAEMAAARKASEEARDRMAAAEKEAAVLVETRRGELKAEEDAITRERERLVRERATAVTEKAAREAAATTELAKLEREREVVEESWQKVMAERKQVASLRADLDREREAFQADVDELTKLGHHVRAESVAVREAMANSHAELAQSERLVAMVEEEKQNIENEKRAAMAAMSELVEGRKRFEAERLDTAKMRKQLAEEKVALSRSTEATRLMQLQLVTSMTAPTGAQQAQHDTKPPPDTSPALPSPPTARGEASAPPVAPDGGGGPGGGMSGVESTSMPPTPERAWRQWVKPAVRPRPISSAAPPSTATSFAPAPASHRAGGGLQVRPPMGSLAEEGEVVRVDSEALSAVKAPAVPAVAPPANAPPSTEGGGEWRDRWREDYRKAAASLHEQMNFLQGLHNPAATAPPRMPGGGAAGAVAPAGRVGAVTHTPPSEAAHIGAGATAARSTPGGMSLTSSDWSPGPCGTLGASASIGGSTVASSRLSYQWPTNVSIGTLHATDSNLSTPSRGGVRNSSYGGVPPLAGQGYGYGGASSSRSSAYAAGQHTATSVWYNQRGGVPGPASTNAGGLAGHNGSSSSSMVSLHNVRLSSWGSLPSRSSSSPAHPAEAMPSAGASVAAPSESQAAEGAAEASASDTADRPQP